MTYLRKAVRPNMLRSSCVALCVVFSAVAANISSSSASAQAPEVTVTARSIDDLQVVIRSLGDKSELFGLSGPDTFLTNYGQYINTAEPLVAVMTISTATPNFLTELNTTNSKALFTALAEEGFVLNATTGELSKPDTALRFYVELNGNRLRVADSKEFSQKTRLPATGQTNASAGATVTVQVDWRNLSLESRKAACQRGLSLLLPTENSWSLTYEGLPGLVNDLMTQRVATLMNRAEQFTLQFNIDSDRRVGLNIDVLHRAIASARNVESPFSQLSSEDVLLSCQWNLPIEGELRTLVNNWASAFSGNLKALFRDEQVADPQGWSTLESGAQVISQNCKESISLERLQGSLLVREVHGHPVAALGVRVANAARLDGDLRKLIQAAVESGAPLSRPEYNIATSSDLNLHRVQLILGSNPTSTNPDDGAYTITVGTSTHGLLIGVGPANEKLVEELIAPTSQRSTEWLSFHWSKPANVRGESPAKAVVEKMAQTTPTLSLQPLAQGFRITTELPSIDTKRSVQYTGTRNPPSTLP